MSNDADATDGVPFKGGPLDGLRVLVTRAKQDSGDLVHALESEGAECASVPLIEFRPPSSWEPLDRAIGRLERYDWLVFTSRNGVRAFFQRWEARRAEWPSSIRVGVVGPGTAEELSKHGVSPDVVPETATGPGLFAALLRSGVVPEGRRFLLPRAEVGRPELPAALTGAGAVVDAVPGYRTAPCWDSKRRLRDVLRRRWPDVITFTSGSAVDSCVELLEPDAKELLAGAAIAAIGPTTGDAAKRRGVRVDCVAEPHTVPGLVAALVQWRATGARAANDDGGGGEDGNIS